MNDDGNPRLRPGNDHKSSAVSDVSKSAMQPRSQEIPSSRNQEAALAFKVSHVFSTIFLCWLLLVHLIGIYFFANGFLLTRVILDAKSECSVLPGGGVASVEGGCWHPKTFDRAVIIIIDALRYDFTVPFYADVQTPQHRPFHNALKVLYETAVAHPENAFLRPFIADPPTTTLQRLKGLTTGSLPTFIEAGSNFAGTAIEEDNLLAQLKEAGKTLVHLGDDTWHALFPNYFDPNLTHAYDSLNSKDIHTVDNGVIQHILPLLSSSAGAHWDVTFAHFLGVDHVGHTFGPDHKMMGQKLEQMDGVLRDIIKEIDDKTLLVVMGDHGMDVMGNHGGESDEELEAALWMYSKKGVFGRTSPSFSTPPLTAKERPVRQTDLVSTLSLLLGVPIPYNNLGAPIDEAFTGPKSPNWENLAKVNLLSFDQIQRYQLGYSQARELETNEMQERLRDVVSHTLQGSSNSKWQIVHSACRDWQHETLQMYKRLWANFDYEYMMLGVALLACGLLNVIVFLRSDVASRTTLLPDLVRAIGRGIGAGATVGALLPYALPEHFTAISGAVYGVGLGGSIVSTTSLFGKVKSWRRLLPSSFWGWLMVAYSLSQAAGFATNSYTIHEDSILLFFLTSFGVVSLFSACRQYSKVERVLGIYHCVQFTILTRVASLSRLCREEQMPGCSSTFYAASNSTSASTWRLLMCYLIALVLPEIIKAFYKGTASYEGSAGLWIGFCFRIGLSIVAAVWTADAADVAGWLEGRLSQTILDTVKLTLARSVVVVAVAIGVATYVYAAPCVSISVVEPSAPSETASSRPQIAVMGYANIHGTRYFLLLPIFVLLVSLVLPPMGQFSMAILTWQILCLCEILDTNRLNMARSSVGPIVLAMLGSYHFFKTGHQAVLASIQWNAAFTLTPVLKYPWAPIMMTLNTFGPQILCAVAVPLSVLWKRPGKKGLRGIMADVTRACTTHILYYAVMQLATTMWAGHLRRHLMLYRVFMPRFLMGIVVLVIVDVMLIVVALMGVRVSSLSVGEVFGW